jgi:hypothetical protein
MGEGHAGVGRQGVGSLGFQTKQKAKQPNAKIASKVKIAVLLIILKPSCHSV